MLRLPLKNKQKMNNLKISRQEKNNKSLTNSKQEYTGKRKKIKSKQIKNKVFGISKSTFIDNCNKYK